MKKQNISYAVFIIFCVLFSSSSHLTHAQSTEKTIQSVKESVNSLIEAKDNNDSKEEVIRLDTYKKILDLAIEDAQDMRLKLLAFDDNKTTTTLNLWKKNRIENLNDAIKHFQKEKLTLEEEYKISSEEIKQKAEDLKKWRESEYVPLIEEIQAFFLIEQQKKSIETNTKRFEKIQNDIEKLRKAKFKKIKELDEKSKKAKVIIDESKEINKNAEHEFQKKYLISFMEEDSKEKNDLLKQIQEDQKNIEKQKNKTDENYPPLQPLSIKDMVDKSFSKTKESYQIFIEMSNFVRKLL